MSVHVLILFVVESTELYTRWRSVGIQCWRPAVVQWNNESWRMLFCTKFCSTRRCLYQLLNYN